MTKINLSRRDVRTVKQMKRDIENLALKRGDQYLPQRSRENTWGRVVYTVEVLEGASGTTPGSGYCQIVKLDHDTGELDRLITNNEEQQILVYNLGGKIPEGTFFNVFRDPWGVYWSHPPVAIAESKWFKTDGGGVPAAGSPSSPGSAQAERMRFDGLTIVSAEDPPVFETIWNGAPAAVRANDFVQCARIDGEWFVNVEYCRE